MVSGIGLPLEPIPGDNNALRLGTQELTLWGMKPDDMKTVAELVAGVLVQNETPEGVCKDVRAAFQEVGYVR